MTNPITPPDKNPETPIVQNLDAAPGTLPDPPLEKTPVKKPEDEYVYKLNPKEEVKPRNMKQLADDLGVSLRVARKYIKSIAHKIGERASQMFSRKQVTIVYEHFGYPKRFLMF
jgi:hypothetical protein